LSSTNGKLSLNTEVNDRISIGGNLSYSEVINDRVGSENSTLLH
jgi:hypothetical protein